MSARDELFRRVAGAFVSEDRANKLIDDVVAEALPELAALRARVAELEGAAEKARTEAIADAGDYLDEAGEKNAAYLLYTTDVPVAREMKLVPQQRGEAR
ncbi:hypothetical protein [Streptomyces filamentosus]|uniref:hypothetical protein n=1 Tax=Streptomyces filamentosus TaxID=67294 RepID=UPI0014792BB9|nr:hypothetical protein [Streptomyces filamentosus]